MQNHSTVLDQTAWGIHLNFEGYFASPPNHLSWLTQLQQQDWQRRGVVLWDADHRTVAHLYAGYALELLEHLQGNDTWKTNGLAIGSPPFQLSTSSADNPSPKMGGAQILENQMKLPIDKLQVLIEFLTEQETIADLAESEEIQSKYLLEFLTIAISDIVGGTLNVLPWLFKTEALIL